MEQASPELSKIGKFVHFKESLNPYACKTRADAYGLKYSPRVMHSNIKEIIVEELPPPVPEKPKKVKKSRRKREPEPEPEVEKNVASPIKVRVLPKLQSLKSIHGNSYDFNKLIQMQYQILI